MFAIGTPGFEVYLASLVPFNNNAILQSSKFDRPVPTFNANSHVVASSAIALGGNWLRMAPWYDQEDIPFLSLAPF